MVHHFRVINSSNKRNEQMSFAVKKNRLIAQKTGKSFFVDVNKTTQRPLRWVGGGG